MNTITIFDGSQFFETDTYNSGVPLVSKGTFEVSGDMVLRRDLTQLKTSELTVIDKDKVILPQDYIIFNFDGLNRVGKVFTVDRTFDITTLTFVFGADTHQMDIPLYGNPDFQYTIWNNRQAIKILVYRTSVDSTVISDGGNKSISSDTIFRQILRRSHLAEGYTSEALNTGQLVGFNIWLEDEGTLYPTPLPPIKIKLDDPYVNRSYLLKIGQDKMTRLRIYDSADAGIWRDYQLLTDGSIVENTIGPTDPWYHAFLYSAVHPDSVRPQRLSIKEAGNEEVLSLDYAKDIFYQSEYDNEIEIELPVDNPYFKLGAAGTSYGSETFAKDLLLGYPVTVYLPNSATTISTIVSGYEIQGGVMKIIFGLSRTRLTDVINNYINKDNQ